MPKYKMYISYARTAIYLVLLSIGIKDKKSFIAGFYMRYNAAGCDSTGWRDSSVCGY